MSEAMCQKCGRPMSEHRNVGVAGPNQELWVEKRDRGPITQATKWDDINPHGGTWIDNPVNRVLSVLKPNGGGEGGWKFLEGWSQQERIEVIKKWIKSVWSTPWAMLQTLPEAEEDVAILFIAWAMGWNVSFGGKRVQACYQQPGGYRWNPFTRQCEKIPTYIRR